jgi:hypothetical protein
VTFRGVDITRKSRISLELPIKSNKKFQNKGNST